MEKTIDELVAQECRFLATEIIEKKLAALDLPLPKESSMDAHVQQLLKANPQIEVTARERVLAQQDAYSEALRAIGIEVPTLPLPVDIEL